MRFKKQYFFSKSSSLPDEAVAINLLVNEVTQFLSKAGVYLIPSFVVFLALFFIRKDFSLMFIYGVFFSFVFITLNLLLTYLFVKKAYPSILSNLEKETKDIFFVSKIAIALVIVLIFYSLYKRFGVNYDYPVVIIGSVWLFYILHIFVFNRYKKHNLFLSTSSALFIVLSVFLVGFKYLNLIDIKLVLYSWLLFGVAVVVDEIGGRIRVLKGLIHKDLAFFLIYPFLLAGVVYKNYSNLFIFLGFFIVYLMFLWLFKRDEFFERYNNFILFFLMIFFFFITKMTHIFIVGMSYERYLILLIMLLGPICYYSVVWREYRRVVNLIPNALLLEKTEPDILSTKIAYILVVLSFGVGFKIAYDYLIEYFGYSDKYSFFSIVIPIFFFYLMELYADVMIKKLENQLVNLIFNISVITFIFSASVVICSYTFGINYINLISLFYPYAFLTLLFSSRYISYIVSILYLSSVYIIIYV